MRGQREKINKRLHVTSKFGSQERGSGTRLRGVAHDSGSRISLTNVAQEPGSLTSTRGVTHDSGSQISLTNVTQKRGSLTSTRVVAQVMYLMRWWVKSTKLSAGSLVAID